MLWQRILTALVLVGLLALLLFVLPRPAAAVGISLLFAAGAWEWARFAALSAPAARAGYVLACAAAAALLWLVAGRAGGLAVLLWLTLGWWVAALGWMALARRRVSRGAAAIGGVLTLAPAWLALVTLAAAGERGPEFVLFTFVLVGAADVGAYFAGRRWGRTKLAPSISPGKTWEGVLGGFTLAAVAGVAGSAWFGLPAGGFLPLCAAVVAISIVGDLTESMFKRAAGLKDSGRLLPGHGGVLDRIDSLSAAAPLLLLGLTWLGVAP